MYSEEVHTNITKIFENNIKNIEELYDLRFNKSQTDFIVQVLLALMASRSVHFNEIAAKIDGKAETESKLRQIQRFVADYELDYY